MKTTNKINTTSAVLIALALSAAGSFAGTTANIDGSTMNSSVVPTSQSEGARAGFKFQINLDYVDTGDLSDTIEDHNPAYDIDTIWPVGVSLNPYYEFNNGFAVGMSLGPAIFASGDASFYVIPVGLDARYTFMRDAMMSPFIRTGVQYAFAGGDFIETGDVGFYAKVGIEFGHSKKFGWGIEAGYSSSSVEVQPGAGKGAEDVDPYNFTAGFFGRF
jgi:hypothetical protein